MAEKFFDEQTEQSQVKAEIVSKYFWAWAKVIISVQKRNPHRSEGRIAYIDLFAGPGRYRDGTKSTPVKIVEKAIADPDMCARLVAIFNDRDPAVTSSLQQALKELPGVETMKYQPEVFTGEVGPEDVKELGEGRLVPTLFFVDPFGYKGLSLGLVNAVLKNWGCDCIFFFNYNRISMGLGNEYVSEHMDVLFGKERADRLRARLEMKVDPVDRELFIVEELAQALKGMGGQYVLPFRFRNERGTRTSHHLIFVSKHPRGYGIMKGIMAKESTTADQGVPSFEYNPADKRMPMLFELSRPLDDLKTILLDEFAGRTLTMQQVFELHNLGRRFIKKNYKSVLSEMEAEGLVKADPAQTARRKGTFADSVKVTFPPKKGKNP